MSRNKDLYMAAEEEMIGQYMDDHPEATEEEASLAVNKDPSAVSNHVSDRLADQADFENDRRRDSLM
mgnify:CR=1 FL=1|jgi:hypothetical protein